MQNRVLKEKLIPKSEFGNEMETLRKVVIRLKTPTKNVSPIPIIVTVSVVVISFIVFCLLN